LILFVLACASAPPPAELDTLLDGHWHSEEANLSLDFGPGWMLVMDPASFRSELPATRLEAAKGELKVALTFSAVPPMAMQGASALDLLTELSPALGAAEEPDYRLERLPHCTGPVGQDTALRQIDGHTWIAQRTGTGLAILHAWDADPAPAIQLFCGG
jgi:hypothetical protein